MRTRVIYNPRAGSAEQIESLRERLASRTDTELVQTDSAGHARDLAASSSNEGIECVLAAGGDGTVNEVVNGLMSLDPPRPVLGVLPFGTGNDLPRTLAIPPDPIRALAVVDEGRIRLLDVMRVLSERGESYCINVAAGGFTGQMNEAMTDELKATWGPLAYLRGAIGVLPDLTRYRTQVRYDGGRWQPVSAMNVIVANGRTAGGGTVVAPLANPEDGLLDVVVVHTGTVLELGGVAARLLGGNYLESDLVTHRRARRVEIRSVPGMWFNVDGELLTREPVVFWCEPAALRVIVGPEYTPEAAA